MSLWKDYEDFMHDVERVSVFYVSGSHNLPCNKFVLKPKAVVKAPVHTPWYDSDSSEEKETCKIFGRGRALDFEDKKAKVGVEPEHHQVMKEIQQQVRSTVGIKYCNDVLEFFYNQHDDNDKSNTPTEEASEKKGPSAPKILKTEKSEEEEKKKDV